ncbi:unnamed protein product [Cylindrotheca closterium]|uniref:Exonuclease domain-containing protein n=1 Tax=Cylindrotheca closterium TaxID=2856 RepID=A0AAD2G4T5_9STRA|nr:unnamed protein product [Cylindrotheca closterium]
MSTSTFYNNNNNNAPNFMMDNTDHHLDVSFSSSGSFEDSPTRVKGQNPWGTSSNRASSPSFDVSNRENATTTATTTTTGHSYSNVGFQMPHPSSIVALDCEMVGVGKHGDRSSVARVTLIDWEGNALIDSYVIQKLPVTDYRTFVSGITKDNLEGASMTLEQCREQVSRLLYNRILVGHGLKNDLDALGINQPWWLTRDTATYLPFMKKRANNLAWWPRKLKELSCEKLEREIQVYGKPHSPFEDALAALDLYKTVQAVWEQEIYTSLMKTNKFKQQHLTDQRMALMQRQNNNHNMYHSNHHRHHYHNNNKHYRYKYHPSNQQQRYYVPQQQLVQ